jgi:hypothetical protein
VSNVIVKQTFFCVFSELYMLLLLFLQVWFDLTDFLQVWFDLTDFLQVWFALTDFLQVWFDLTGFFTSLIWFNWFFLQTWVRRGPIWNLGLKSDPTQLFPNPETRPTRSRKCPSHRNRRSNRKSSTSGTR